MGAEASRVGMVTGRAVRAVPLAALSLALPALGWAWSLSTDVAVLQAELAVLRGVGRVLQQRVEVCESQTRANGTAVAHLSGVVGHAGHASRP